MSQIVGSPSLSTLLQALLYSVFLTIPSTETVRMSGHMRRHRSLYFKHIKILLNQHGARVRVWVAHNQTKIQLTHTLSDTVCQY